MDEKRREMLIGMALSTISEEFSDEDRQKIREEYKYQGETNEITRHAHLCLVGCAANAAIGLLDRDATYDEVLRILKYLAICIDARKYYLDHPRAYTELGIRELSHKYGLSIYR